MSDTIVNKSTYHDDENNQSLQFLKGIGCIAVVFMHVMFPGTFGEFIHESASFAVPIFFMISGYYAFNKDEVVITRRLVKILKILGIAWLLYFIYNALIHYSNGDIEKWIIDSFSIKSIVYFIAFCTVDYAIHLWYLIAMCEVYLVWIVIVRHRKEVLAISLLPYLFLLRVVFITICETLQVPWSYKVNFGSVKSFL